jgi:hypothetical protein
MNNFKESLKMSSLTVKIINKFAVAVARGPPRHCCWCKGGRKDEGETGKEIEDREFERFQPANK